MDEEAAGDGHLGLDETGPYAGSSTHTTGSADVAGPSNEISRPSEPSAPVVPPSHSPYPPEGRLAHALADHFSQGFETNFLEPLPDDLSQGDLADEIRDGYSTSFAPEDDVEYRDGFEDDFEEDSSLPGGGFSRQLARQFTGEADADGSDEEHSSRPLGLRSLRWIRRNMTSLRIIVSLQRVTPPDLSDDRSRKASGS